MTHCLFYCERLPFIKISWRSHYTTSRQLCRIDVVCWCEKKFSSSSTLPGLVDASHWMMTPTKIRMTWINWLLTLTADVIVQIVFFSVKWRWRMQLQTLTTCFCSSSIIAVVSSCLKAAIHNWYTMLWRRCFIFLTGIESFQLSVDSLYISYSLYLYFYNETRNTLDCDQSNVHSSLAVFSAISPGLFRSSSLYRRSAGDPPSWNKFRISIIID